MLLRSCESPENLQLLPPRSVEAQGQPWARSDGAAGLGAKVAGDVLVRDHRVAPLVERHQLRQELGAVAVGVAANRIDDEALAAHPRSGAGKAGASVPRRLRRAYAAHRQPPSTTGVGSNGR